MNAQTRAFLAVIAALLVAVGCSSIDQADDVTPVMEEVSDSKPRDGFARVGMGYPTGHRATSVLFLEKAYPRAVKMGRPFELNFEITNLTDRYVEDIVLKQFLSEGVRIESSLPMYATDAEGVLVWAMGTLGPREKATVNVVMVADNAETISERTSLTYRSMLESEIVVQRPRLRLTRSAPEEVIGCDEIIFKYTVDNIGNGEAENVLLREMLAEGVTTFADGAEVFEHELGRVDAGETREVLCRVRIPVSQVVSGQAELLRGDTLTAESEVGTTRVVYPKLSIEFDGKTSTRVGKQMPCQVKVFNVGDGPDRDVVVDVQIPDGCSVVNASEGADAGDGTISWRIDELPSRAVRTFGFVFESGTVGVDAGSAIATSNCGQQAVCAFELVRVGTPALQIEVTDVEDPVLVGEEAQYRITVTNHGTDTARLVKVSCQMDPTMVFGSGGGQTEVSVGMGQLAFGVLQGLEPGETAEWIVHAMASGQGDVRFKASVTSERIRRPVEKVIGTNVFNE